MRSFAAGIALPPLAGLLATLWWLPAAHAQATDSASVGISIRILPIASIDFPDGFEFVITVPDGRQGKGHDNGKGKGHDSHGNGNGYGHDENGGLTFIQPVLIPFKVTGNALAMLSAKPDAFMPIYNGPYLGEALMQGGDRHKNQQGNGHSSHGNGNGHGHGGGDDTLGYNIVVQFPIPSWHNAGLGDWSGFGTNFTNGFASLPGQNGAGTPPLTTNVAGQPNGAYGMIYIVARQHWTDDGRDATPGDYIGALEVTLTADGQ